MLGTNPLVKETQPTRVNTQVNSAELNSRIYDGELMHMRCAPVSHRFDYPFYTCAIDVEEIEKLDNQLSLFSYNRFNVVSLHDKDHVPSGEDSIREKLDELFEQHEALAQSSRIELITSLRYFGYVFNPVNFYCCFDESDELIGVVTEVNNTFGETHLYVLSEQVREQKNRFKIYSWPKEFHVSPFNNMDGDYYFYFLVNRQELDIRINMERDGKICFTSRLCGSALPLSNRNLLKTLVKFPLSTALTMPRIISQAARLYFVKNLPVYTKPIAASEMTIRRKSAGILQRAALSLCMKYFSRFKNGCLAFEFPDRQKLQFGVSGARPNAVINVGNYDLFWRSLLFGDVGFGESYVDKQWDADNLCSVFEVFIANKSCADDRSLFISRVGKFLNRLTHLGRSNSRKQSKNNIRAHYDLGNDLFSSFLDQSMTYSCAKFSPGSKDLYDAQLNKLNAIIEKADIRSTDHVLEIGCGWGSFAAAAAKNTGCRVTGVTLSQQQYEYAKQRVEREGLSDRVEILLCDYRELSGKFDKIVSIEMLEAVGHEYLGEYFAKCDSLLKPNGLAVLQVITFPDQQYEDYRQDSDWIQKYIFPGGICPSLSAILAAVTDNSSFVVDNVENIGPHYAATLRIWQERFDANYSKLKKHGYDEKFYRMWKYYLSYCEAGFRSNMLGTLQIVLNRPVSENV